MAVKITGGGMAKINKPDDQTLKEKLTREQYEVTQMCGTEPPFQNAFWNNKAEGIYVDIVSGEPLFSSIDKYDSGTGWPSFTRPLVDQNITYHQEQDRYRRIEVRSLNADSHLGHVFDDGPGPSGQRYCINSASLRFIPVSELEKEGYGEYAELFQKKTAGAKETAVFAGGCFWGVEEIFRKVPGVLGTTVGYTGGSLSQPTYKQVCTGTTGHAEAIEITFDPSRVSFEQLTRLFFRMHDPTTLNRQHNDIGTQYRSAIFAQNQAQKTVARKIIQELTEKGEFEKPIVTMIEEPATFYSAEEEHQDYLVKNPGGYNCHYIRPEKRV